MTKKEVKKTIVEYAERYEKGEMKNKWELLDNITAALLGKRLESILLTRKLGYYENRKQGDLALSFLSFVLSFVGYPSFFLGISLVLACSSFYFNILSHLTYNQLIKENQKGEN
jgi:hypothetical protein